jgi:hypothetical protein
MSNRIRSYDELRALVHDCLRSQNPQWVDANGKSPMCDQYEARLAHLLQMIKQKEGNK